MKKNDIRIMLAFPLTASEYDVLNKIVSKLGTRHYGLGGRHAKRGWHRCTCGLAAMIRKLDKGQNV